MQSHACNVPYQERTRTRPRVHRQASESASLNFLARLLGEGGPRRCALADRFSAELVTSRPLPVRHVVDWHEREGVACYRTRLVPGGIYYYDWVDDLEGPGDRPRVVFQDRGEHRLRWP